MLKGSPVLAGTLLDKSARFGTEGPLMSLEHNVFVPLLMFLIILTFQSLVFAIMYVNLSATVVTSLKMTPSASRPFAMQPRNCVAPASTGPADL